MLLSSSTTQHKPRSTTRFYCFLTRERELRRDLHNLNPNHCYSRHYLKLPPRFTTTTKKIEKVTNSSNRVTKTTKTTKISQIFDSSVCDQFENILKDERSHFLAKQDAYKTNNKKWYNILLKKKSQTSVESYQVSSLNWNFKRSSERKSIK